MLNIVFYIKRNNDLFRLLKLFNYKLKEANLRDVFAVIYLLKQYLYISFFIALLINVYDLILRLTTITRPISKPFKQAYCVSLTHAPIAHAFQARPSRIAFSFANTSGLSRSATVFF